MLGKIVLEGPDQGGAITAITVICEGKARGSVSDQVRSLSNTDTPKHCGT